jgi:cytoskeleton protein RodZ
MPLDSGGVTQIFRTEADEGDMSSVDMPSLEYGPDVGAALKAAREFKGLSLQDVSDATRIRRAYLAAVEDMRLDELPSRPFALGYIKSYAQLLGFDPDAAVARFKDVSPDPDEPLRAPVGVRSENDPRLGAVFMGGVVIVAAIALWNVAQRAINEDAPPQPSAPEAAMLTPSAPTGPMALGAPLPAPVESTTPELYVTPGLEAAAAAGGSADAAEAAKKERIAQAAAAPAAVDTAAPTAFAAKGKVYGAPAQQASAVTVQARKPASIIVRGADGAVYFARQLAAGEAYRAPSMKGLTIDVSDPAAFDVFVAGQSKGVLPATQTTLSSLVG